MSPYEILDRIAIERRFFERDLRNEYTNGVIYGMKCAANVIRAMIEERKTDFAQGRKHRCSECNHVLKTEIRA